jgi:hypothetical protein
MYIPAPTVARRKSQPSMGKSKEKLTDKYVLYAMK